jgi:hypothetical protein
MVAKDSNGNNAMIPGLILNDQQDVRRYVRSIFRHEQRKNRDSSFLPESFKLSDHLPKLQKQNMRLTGDLV